MEICITVSTYMHFDLPDFLLLIVDQDRIFLMRQINLDLDIDYRPYSNLNQYQYYNFCYYVSNLDSCYGSAII